MKLHKRNAPAQRSRLRILNSNKSVTVSHQPNTKSFNHLTSLKRRSLSSKIQFTGSNSSHLKVKRIFKNSVSLLIGEDLSSPQTLTHTMIHSSDGNSIPSRRRRESSSVTDTPSTPKLMDSHALIMIDQRVKESVLRNTPLSN